jgi:hypothetical protein
MIALGRTSGRSGMAVQVITIGYGICVDSAGICDSDGKLSGVDKFREWDRPCCAGRFSDIRSEIFDGGSQCLGAGVWCGTSGGSDAGRAVATDANKRHRADRDADINYVHSTRFFFWE